MLMSNLYLLQKRLQSRKLMECGANMSARGRESARSCGGNVLRLCPKAKSQTKFGNVRSGCGGTRQWWTRADMQGRRGWGVSEQCHDDVYVCGREMVCSLSSSSALLVFYGGHGRSSVPVFECEERSHKSHGSVHSMMPLPRSRAG